MRIFVCTLFALIAFNRCIGSRHTVKMDEMNYAVSMTPIIYGSDGNMRSEGFGLDKLADIEVTHRYWSLLYSFVPFGDTTAQVRKFNAAIARHGGQGVINFSVENEGCEPNNFAYLVVPAVIPFFPGCSKVTMRGRVVRESAR